MRKYCELGNNFIEEIRMNYFIICDIMTDHTGILEKKKNTKQSLTIIFYLFSLKVK